MIKRIRSSAKRTLPRKRISRRRSRRALSFTTSFGRRVLESHLSDLQRGVYGGGPPGEPIFFITGDSAWRSAKDALRLGSILAEASPQETGEGQRLSRALMEIQASSRRRE